ncbi:MAG: tail fiber protein [Bacteroidia bacterium]
MVLGGTGVDAVNVGINTTTPNNKLEIVHGTAGSSGLRLTSMPNAVLLGTNASGDIVPSTTPNVANAMFWGLTGNSGTVAGTNFIGTTDNVDVVFKRNNVQSGLLSVHTSFGVNALNPATTGAGGTVAIGNGALAINTTGSANSAVGFSSLSLNTTGSSNTALGHQSLQRNTTGTENVAIGNSALYFNTTGGNNIANGYLALSNSTTGSNNISIGALSSLKIDNTIATSPNTVVGTQALFGGAPLPANNTASNNVVVGYQAMYGTPGTPSTGGSNVAVGNQALSKNTTGTQNSVNGHQAMYSNTTGTQNVANGAYSLYYNTTGHSNIANGVYSLYYNTTGHQNTANGMYSLTVNTTGFRNTANGFMALEANSTGTDNTADGAYSMWTNTTGYYNTANGYQSLMFNSTGGNNTASGVQGLGFNTTGGNNTAIGYQAGATNTIGSNNTYLGYSADATLNNLNKATAIGYNAKVGVSNAMVLGGTGVDAVNVGINTTAPATSAQLDVTSTTAGFAMPRMTSVQRKAIVAPIAGLQVYDLTLKGVYIHDGTKWDCLTEPAGTINYFANATAPNGYLECNAQAVSRTTYAELFAAIGTLYGVGDGSTTFNLPDLRGEFVRGVDNARGVDAGRAIGTAQIASTHKELFGAAAVGTFNDWWSDSKGVVTNDGVVNSTPANGGYIVNPGGGINSNPAAVVVSEFKHRPRNVAMLPCIKF